MLAENSDAVIIFSARKGTKAKKIINYRVLRVLGILVESGVNDLVGWLVV